MSRLAIRFAAASAALTTLAAPQIAEACGCFSPPEPQPVLAPGAFAVNQQAEQIIFEVDGAAQEITAHVMIQYEGDPDAFAWIVPVPDVPQLGLSPALAFGVLQGLTEPTYRVDDTDVCPEQRFSCAYHDPCPTGTTGDGDGGSWGDGDGTTGDGDGTTTGDGTGGTPPGGVTVEDTQTIGAYEVTTLSATSAAELATWLSSNGYFVSPQAEPYMQPYLDAGMKFVAAKLASGAGVDNVTPLRMTFPGTTPMIPLRLTAVAAEPNMAVRAYIYGDSTYHPVGHPVLDQLAGLDHSTPQGTGVNAEAAMLRTIDEAGGDAFIREYAGAVRATTNAFPDTTGCCGSGWDYCYAGYDDVCNCPFASWDQADCQQDAPELLEAIEFLEGLRQQHTHLTRLTTRLSAHEMTFDPMFEPDASPLSNTWSHTTVSRPVVAGCENSFADLAEFDRTADQMACSALYCGAGSCVMTGGGASCECDAGHVARETRGLDGQTTVTCVPETSPLDFGPDAPDPCNGVSCGMGQCVAVGGFATCECWVDTAAYEGGSGVRCDTIDARFGDDPGGGSYSAPLATADICSPTPPSCGTDGWLVERSVSNPGVECPGNVPPPEAFEPSEPPVCGDTGGSTGSDGGSNGSEGAEDGGWAEGTGGEGGLGGDGLPGLPNGCGCEVGPRDTKLGGLLALLGLLGWRRRGRGRITPSQ